MAPPTAAARPQDAAQVKKAVVWLAQQVRPAACHDDTFTLFTSLFGFAAQWSVLFRSGRPPPLRCEGC